MEVKKLLGLCLVLIISLVAIKPLFISGFFPIHDDTQVARVFEMGKMLKLGVFPVRWVPDLGYGYGYPIFNFYAPFAYYVGGLFHAAGFDALLATKIMIGFGMILAGVTMFFLAEEFFGIAGGLIAALFYVYAPYHALDLYVRGDIAELYAYAFLPLVFYALWKVSYEQKLRYVLTGAAGIAGLVLSHNLSAFVLAPFIAAFGLLLVYANNKRGLVFKKILFSVVLGVILSAFYWLPALFEMGQTNVLSQVGGGADYKDHFVCLSQLWDSPWGFGGSAKGCLDGLSFRIGKLHLLLGLFSVGVLFMPWKKEKKLKTITGFFIVCSCVALFMTLEMSQVVWDAFAQMAFLQYPWRYLLPLSFFTSFLSGAFMIFTKEKGVRWVIAGVLVLFLLVSYLKLFNPQTIQGKTASDYTSDFALKWTASKISDEYLPKNFDKPRTPDQVAKHSFTFVPTPIEQIGNAVSIAGVVMTSAAIIYATRRNS